MNKIQQALDKLFEKHRIVFWYDVKKELRADYDALDMAGVEKIELINNEFGVKYRILREQPDNRFLIYREGPQPADMDNWLLDVQLAHAEFRTDQVAIWLAELELGPEFADVAKSHAMFYQSAKRRESLKLMLDSEDTFGMIRLKMLAVCAGADPRMNAILEILLAELAEDRDDKIKLISRCHLDGFLWEQMKRCYGYHSESPGIQDFVITLFKSCYALGTDGKAKLTGDALVFLKRWKDSRSGIETVKEILRKHYVHRNEAGLVRSTIKEKGQHKVIDKISVALNDKTDAYEASFSNLGIKKVLVDSATIKAHPKLLVSGVWCIADLEYYFTEDKNAGPWILTSLKPIQISHFDFEKYVEARKQFGTEEWIDLLIQSIGFNPEMFGKRSKLTQLVRLIPFCERNYNLIELGPKGTGKSHIYSEFSPHGILISGGEVTMPKLFVNNSTFGFQIQRCC